jgi:hypothetical protein
MSTTAASALMAEHKQWYASAIEELERRVAALDEKERASKAAELDQRADKIKAAISASGF